MKFDYDYGGYEVQGFLSSGGLGYVHKVKSISTVATEAIKYPKCRGNIKHMEWEIEQLSKLIHPCLISIEHMARWKEIPLLIMPLADGGSLDCWMSIANVAMLKVVSISSRQCKLYGK